MPTAKMATSRPRRGHPHRPVAPERVTASKASPTAPPTTTGRRGGRPAFQRFSVAHLRVQDNAAVLRRTCPPKRPTNDACARILAHAVVQTAARVPTTNHKLQAPRTRQHNQAGPAFCHESTSLRVSVNAKPNSWRRARRGAGEYQRSELDAPEVGSSRAVVPVRALALDKDRPSWKHASINFVPKMTLQLLLMVVYKSSVARQSPTQACKHKCDGAGGGAICKGGLPGSRHQPRPTDVRAPHPMCMTSAVGLGARGMLPAWNDPRRPQRRTSSPAVPLSLR